MARETLVLSTGQVCTLLQISRATLYRLAKTDGSFPRPLAYKTRAKVYDAKAIEEWIGSGNKKALNPRNES